MKSYAWDQKFKTKSRQWHEESVILFIKYILLKLRYVVEGSSIIAHEQTKTLYLVVRDNDIRPY